MAVKRFKELFEKLPKDRQRRISARVERTLVDMELAEVRKMLHVTQAELAKKLSTSQGQVSQIESGAVGHRLATIRRHIEALGGEVEVIARFGDKSVRLRVV